MTAKNMAQLESMLMKQIKKAMRVASKKIEADMYEETGDFYTGGEPKVYERTGALGDTPRTTGLTVSGNSAKFEAYLDQNHNYTTGDKPNMEQVLRLANNGVPWITKRGNPARRTVGKKGFWDRAIDKMEKTLDDTMSNFFEKK